MCDRFLTCNAVTVYTISQMQHCEHMSHIHISEVKLIHMYIQMRLKVILGCVTGYQVIRVIRIFAKPIRSNSNVALLGKID